MQVVVPDGCDVETVQVKPPAAAAGDGAGQPVIWRGRRLERHNGQIARRLRAIGVAGAQVLPGAKRVLHGVIGALEVVPHQAAVACGKGVVGAGVAVVAVQLVKVDDGRLRLRGCEQG